MRLGRVLAWLRLRERPISVGVALASLAVALLSSLAAVLQTGLLLGQLRAPYQTALYVRQLEVAGDFYAAAHEQYAAIIDLDSECKSRMEQGIDTVEDYWNLSERFRAGATEFHTAFTAAMASFPSLFNTRMWMVWSHNERLVENVVTAAATCSRMRDLYTEHHGLQRAELINYGARGIVNDMRLLLRVDRWSQRDLERERERWIHATRAPGVKGGGKALALRPEAERRPPSGN